MAMNERREITDDAITTLLEGRAARAKADGLLAAIREEAALTPQRRSRRLGFGLAGRSLAAGLAGVATLIVLVVALGIASGGRLPGIGQTSPGPSFGSRVPIQPSASAQAPASPVQPLVGGAVSPLTVNQLNALMAADLNGLIGRRLVITGSVRGISAACFNSNACPSTDLLVGSNPRLEVKSIPADVALNGQTTFSAVLIDAGTLGFEATVATTVTGGAFLPSQLVAAENASHSTGYRLVQGWISGIPILSSCPQARPSPDSFASCGEPAFLGDTSVLPQTSNSLPVPANSVRVQNGAYVDFAPAPSTVYDSSRSLVSVPEEGTFLVKAVYTSPCPPGAFCAFSPAMRGWQIIARLDPWPEPTTSATPAPPSGSTSAVRPLTVDELSTFMAGVGTQYIKTARMRPNRPRSGVLEPGRALIGSR